MLLNYCANEAFMKLYCANSYQGILVVVYPVAVICASASGAITLYGSPSLWSQQIDPASLHFSEDVGHYGYTQGMTVDPNVWAADHGIRIATAPGVSMVVGTYSGIVCNTPSNYGWFSLKYDQPIRAGYYYFESTPAYLFSNGQAVGVIGTGGGWGFVSDIPIDEVRFGNSGLGQSFRPKLYYSAYGVPIPAPASGVPCLALALLARRRRRA